MTERSQVAAMAYCEDESDPELKNIVEVYPPEGRKILPEGWQRRFFASSSCGLCGKTSIEGGFIVWLFPRSTPRAW